MEKEAAIAAVASLLGVLIKTGWDSWRVSHARRIREHDELSTAQIEDEGHKRDLLVAAYNQMIQAERTWTQKEIELERRCYIAEEKLTRREEEYSRELRGAQLLSEEQHTIIVQREAVIDLRDREIGQLKTRLDGCTCGNTAAKNEPLTPS